MVRIFPHRLLSFSSASSASPSPSNSTTNLPASNATSNRKTSTSPPGRKGPMRTKSDQSPSRDPNNGLLLKVVISKARGLAAKDRSGTSDPYLVVSLGDATKATHTVPKTLDPEWNVIEDFTVASVNDLLLSVICWDKDRIGKDYLGEFDLPLETIFANDKPVQEPKWYPLRSKRTGKKNSVVSGEVQLQFNLIDPNSTGTSPEHVMAKFNALIGALPTGTPSPGTPSIATPLSGSHGAIPRSVPSDSNMPGSLDDDDDELSNLEEDTSDELDDPTQPEATERKRRRRLRIKGLKRKKRQNPFAFSNGDSDLVGVIFLEIAKITDLPPEHNLTRTTFDMDPFVVTSLGRKTYRTKRIRHNLNPVFNEKMIFHVQNSEQQYSFSFTVIDHDKYSSNDFIASTTLPVQELIQKAPTADPKTGLYDLGEPAEYAKVPSKSRLKRLGMSRTSSSQSLSKMVRPAMSKSSSTVGKENIPLDPNSGVPAAMLVPADTLANTGLEPTTEQAHVDAEDPEFFDYTIPLKMKNLEKWEAKHNPTLYVRAKYMPYAALRQQFWRAMLKQYDTDESGNISRIEMTTMLDSLGSTLRESTIDSFFQRFPHKGADGDDMELTMDEAVICLEDKLQAIRGLQPDIAAKMKQVVPGMRNLLNAQGKQDESVSDTSGTSTPAIVIDSNNSGSSDMTKNGSPDGELNDSDENIGEEHVVEIRECPICHQPRLNKRNDTDIITHIATCASGDWRQVNSVMMSGFVTASQAQRKWYSKVITKISYGGYKLGANSANILVQDRLTGQINEEKMSVYVRLGIRMLYKGLKSREMETKRIRRMLKKMSVKQGVKFDDPKSREQIEKFIEFHGLDMSEVLLPLEDFKNFNEFFYRALKPGARPCSAPDQPSIIVSPADCRSVVFDQIDQATQIWVKGREFNLKRLLGDAYPEDAARYEGGALGIFRLAPQDYHRFHIPVDGIMGKPKTIEGEYYTVNPMAIRSALDVYGENVRVLVPIDSQEHGRVMVICVGAMMVGSTVITRKEGEQVHRAEELGYFKFGGSTLLVLFEPGKMNFDSDLAENSKGALETLVRVGMSVGHSPGVPQWTPDMRKHDHEITAEDKKLAKRRIAGNAALDDSPDGSSEDADGQQSSPSKKMTSRPTIDTFAASAM